MKKPTKPRKPPVPVPKIKTGSGYFVKNILTEKYTFFTDDEKAQLEKKYLEEFVEKNYSKSLWDKVEYRRRNRFKGDHIFWDEWAPAFGPDDYWFTEKTMMDALLSFNHCLPANSENFQFSLDGEVSYDILKSLEVLEENQRLYQNKLKEYEKKLSDYHDKLVKYEEEKKRAQIEKLKKELAQLGAS